MSRFYPLLGYFAGLNKKISFYNVQSIRHINFLVVLYSTKKDIFEQRRMCVNNSTVVTT